MIQGIFSSCCKNAETEEAQQGSCSSANINAASNALDKGCCSISSSPSEDEIRERAYFLWEEAGRPLSDGTEFWTEAERQLTV